MSEKIRWGIISTARIGTEKVIPGIQRSERGVVEAIASRDGGRAREAADRLGIPRSFGSYEALLEDPEIDAIYNPLPNHLHVDWTIAALRAGKHVLCEKPLGMNAADAERLNEVRSDLHLMEAFMVRFHPQWRRVRELRYRPGKEHALTQRMKQLSDASGFVAEVGTGASALRKDRGPITAGD